MRQGVSDPARHHFAPSCTISVHYGGEMAPPCYIPVRIFAFNTLEVASQLLVSGESTPPMGELPPIVIQHLFKRPGRHKRADF